MGNTDLRTESVHGNLSFEGIDAPFNFTNEQWSLSNLPWVRLASRLVKDDHNELTAKMEGMAHDGLVPDLLENIADTKNHLAALVSLLDMALTRSFVALERLGYTPDSPPPDQAVN
ncbi:hypothetical protein [Sphingopyxis sp. MG]|uniref:hypothetical protein n=1 Tax=Sphingopyxis sp. MG TaxID=1866325 RepID=UPI001319BDF5|nr:hypothetical protein [Sphingopyxis sp. MG]